MLKLGWRSEAMYRKLPPLGRWGGFESLEEERGYYRQALEMLYRFMDLFDFKSRIKYLPTKELFRSIEDYKQLIKALSEDYDVSGKFDLILEGDEGLEIVDFKTGKREDGDDFQLKFYKLLASLNFKEPVKKASYLFLQSGNIKEYDLEKEGKIKKLVLDKIGEIEECKEFETRVSKLCAFCMFRNFCPAKKEEVEKVEEEDFSDDLPF